MVLKCLVAKYTPIHEVIGRGRGAGEELGRGKGRGRGRGGVIGDQHVSGDTGFASF